MFEHFNMWYATLLLSVLAMFVYGYLQHYAEACRVRDRARLSDHDEIVAWVCISVSNICLALRESFRGFFGLAELMLGGRGDELDFVVIGGGGMILFSGLVFGLLFAASAIGEMIGMHRAENQARNYRRACRRKTRAEACWECQQTEFVCPVGIDRSPSWQLDLDELSSVLKSYAQGTYAEDNCPVQREVLSSGAKAFIVNLNAEKVYTDQPPRQPTTPPEFKPGGCVIAAFSRLINP